MRRACVRVDTTPVFTSARAIFTRAAFKGGYLTATSSGAIIVAGEGAGKGNGNGEEGSGKKEVRSSRRSLQFPKVGESVSSGSGSRKACWTLPKQNDGRVQRSGIRLGAGAGDHVEVTDLKDIGLTGTSSGAKVETFPSPTALDGGPKSIDLRRRRFGKRQIGGKAIDLKERFGRLAFGRGFVNSTERVNALEEASACGGGNVFVFNERHHKASAFADGQHLGKRIAQLPGVRVALSFRDRAPSGWSRGRGEKPIHFAHFGDSLFGDAKVTGDSGARLAFLESAQRLLCLFGCQVHNPMITHSDPGTQPLCQSALTGCVCRERGPMDQYNGLRSEKVERTQAVGPARLGALARRLQLTGVTGTPAKKRTSRA